jgi:hypothetical protein
MFVRYVHAELVQASWILESKYFFNQYQSQHIWTRNFILPEAVSSRSRVHVMQLQKSSAAYTFCSLADVNLHYANTKRIFLRQVKKSCF